MKNKLHPIRALALLILVLGSSMPIRGQDNAEPDKIVLGAKAGINDGLFRTNNGFSLWDRNSNTFGYQVGVYGIYPLKDFLKARLELLYVNQGAKLADYNYTGTVKNVNAKAHMNMLHIPLVAELGIPDFTGLIKPKLIVGGFYSYTFKVNSTFEQDTYFADGSNRTAHGREDISGLFKHNQYGFIIGIGGEISLGGKPLLVELRYTHTLNNVGIDGFEYSYLGSTKYNKYGTGLYPTSLGLNVSYPIFNLN